MSSHKITLRIGAAVDGDLEKILFEPAARGAARARKAARAESMSARDEQLAILKGRIAQENALVRQQKGHELALERDTIRAKTREHERGLEDRRRTERRIVQQAERETLARAREMEKRLAERSQGVRSFASTATGVAAGVVKRGVGVAADIARGAGVNFDLGSGVKKRVDLEAQATALANAGYVEGEKGPQGIKQDPRAIMADIQRVGEQYGIAQADIGEALDKFVGKTGELATGRDMLDSFAKVMKATGANVEDVASAAGAISNKLGDIPDKANAINKVMLAIAGQGKVGAVEIKDLATQMEKLTSQASKFQTNAALKGVVGTDTGANIAMLGVLAQAARKTEKGSAAQATQSAMAFIRDLTGQTAIKRIGAGTIFADKSKTTLRDPQEIIKDIISKTKGDQSKLSYLMSNQNSRAVVNSFMDPYLKAYGATKGSAKEKDAAGRAAVDDAFKALKNATLSPKAQDEAVAQAMDTTATKVEQFQQKLDRVVGDMADQVIPAFIKLAPVALNAASGLSRLAVWAAEHPMGALGGAAGAGLAKALADQLASVVATRMAAALAGSMALSGLTVATLLIASVGMMAIDHVTKEADKASKGQYANEMEAVNALSEMKAARAQYEKEQAAGQVTEATKARLNKAKETALLATGDLEKRANLGLEYLQGKDIGSPDGEWSSAWNSMLEGAGLNTKGVLGAGTGKTSSEYEKGRVAGEGYTELQQSIEAMQKEMANVTRTLSGTLKVSSVDGAPLSPPGGSSTTGPGG